jgi:hypothetical protein
VTPRPRAGGGAAATTAVLLGLWAGGVTLACNAGVTPGASFETPLLELRVPIGPAGAIPAGSHPLIGLIWSDPLQRAPDVLMPARWISATPSDASYREVVVRIFRPPPPEALIEIARPGDGEAPAQLALGEMVIVDDGNDDGVFEISGPRAEIARPDSYLAGSFQAVVYVARPFPSATPSFPLTPSAGIGYQVVDFGCNGRLSNGTTVLGYTSFQVQPSRLLPELRNCMRSHSP